MESKLTTSIIKVKFIKGGYASGREYTYLAPMEVKLGDAVNLSIKQGTAKGIVTQINVPQEEIEPYKDKVKTILGLAKPHETCSKCNTIPCVCHSECEVCGV